MVTIRILPVTGGKQRGDEPSDEHEIQLEPTPARLR